MPPMTTASMQKQE